MAKVIKKGWTVPSKGKEVKKQSPDERDLDLVLNSFNYSRSFFSSRYEAFRKWLALYHQVITEPHKFKSNLFIPLVYPIVSTILPRMVANLPKFRYEPREESDNQAVEQMSRLVDYQLDRMDFFKKLKMWVKDTLICGTGIAKVFWYRNDDKEYNDPQLELVDLMDFFPDPKATDIDSGDFVIHRTVVAKSFLKGQKSPDGKELYRNLEQLDESFNAIDSSSQFTFSNKSMTVGEIDAQRSLGSPYRQSVSSQIELLEYWGVNPNEDDKEWIFTIANRKVLIRNQKNPFKGRRPFIKMHVDPINHEFYGKGVIEPIEHLQLELNDIRNQRMDNVNLILNRMWQVVRGANVDEVELVSRPGAVIFSDVPNGVTPIITQDVTQSAYQEEALVKQDANNAVGVSDIIQGQLRSADESVPGQVLNKTATGASIAVQQAGSRFKYYLQNIEDALRELGLILYEYNQQFLDEEKIIRIEAPNDFQRITKMGLVDKIKSKIGLKPQEAQKFEFKRINPEDIRNLKLDVKVEAGSTQPIEDTLKQQKVLNLIQVMSQFPITTPETFIELADRTLDAYEVPNKEKILKTLQVPQNKGPETRVNVSLKGDLNPFQAAEIAKTGTGASDQSSDPALVAQLKTNEETNELTKELIKDKGKYGQGKSENTTS